VFGGRHNPAAGMVRRVSGGDRLDVCHEREMVQHHPRPICHGQFLRYRRTQDLRLHCLSRPLYQRAARPEEESNQTLMVTGC
jgi:hypothetical protein